MNPMEGDRIVVVSLIDDPDPIPVGTTGTVTDVEGVGTPYEQVWVKWDGDQRVRTLMLIPEDYRHVRRIEE